VDKVRHGQPKNAVKSNDLRELFEQKGIKPTHSVAASSQQSANLVRYLYDSSSKVIYINLMQSAYHKWQKNGIKHVKRHFDQYLNDDITPPNKCKNASETAVYLQRNKKKTTLKSFNPREILLQNRITYEVRSLILTADSAEPCAARAVKPLAGRPAHPAE
jgi:hypothetical protein